MIQIIRQTHEEKFAMYMKCNKKELANMLIAANDVIKLWTNSRPFVAHKIDLEGVRDPIPGLFTNIKPSSQSI